MNLARGSLDFANIGVAVILIITIIVQSQIQQDALKISRQQLQSAEDVRTAQMRPWVGRVSLTLDLHDVRLENGTILTGDQFKQILDKYEAKGSQTFRTQNQLPPAAVEEIRSLGVKEMIFQMQFQNKGQLPALNISFRHNSTLDHIPTVEEVPPPESVPPIQRRLLLAEDTVFSLATVPYERYDAILEGNHVLYLIYAVDYEYPGGGNGWYTYISRVNPNLSHNQINAQAG